MSRRSMSPEFDPRIADWLEDDPDDAPDAVLTTVLAAFPSIPQRRTSRVPWRTRPMTLTSRLLASASALAVVVIAGVFLLRPGAANGPGAPSPSVPGSPAPSAIAIGPLDQELTSFRYGFTVRHPSDWTVVGSRASWFAGTTNTWDSGLNDEVKGTTVRFSGASQLLSAGQSADAWLAAYAAGGDRASWAPVTIDGNAGWIDYDGGPAAGGTIVPGGRMFDAVVVKGTRAYNFNMDGHVDRKTFDSFLATIVLPTDPVLDKTQTSSRIGYSISYPSTWSLTGATKSWASGYDASDPALSDTFGSKPSLTVTGTKIPAGTTFDTWYAAYAAQRASGTCASPEREESFTVDGVVGRLDVHCPTFYLEVVVPKGGRVYLFTLYGSPTTLSLFEDFLTTVHLDPANAKG